MNKVSGVITTVRSILFFKVIVLSILSSCVLTNIALAQETAHKTITNLVGEKQTQPNNDTVTTPAIDLQLSELIKRHKLTGAPSSNQKLPDINSPKAQLGMKLFFSKSLGGDKNTACASCHHPMLGGGDDLSLSIGVAADKPNALGADRQTSDFKHTQVPRNAPTTFNIAFWKKILFHDGRIERLENNEITTPDMPYPNSDMLAGESLVQAQARFPITSAEEMRGEYLNASLNQTLRRALAKRLQENWGDEFRKGFNDADGKTEDLITEQNYSEAIAAYEQSQVFINNPWKNYVEGDVNALSDDAKKGAKLFFTSQADGGAGCASCHSGDFFTNEKAYNTGMPQIGLGKKNGKSGSNDFGCELTTKLAKDRFRFRTPSLLNVEVTGPWGHAGAYTSLEAVTEHMLSPSKSAKNYDASQLKQKNIDIKDEKTNTLEALNYGIHLKDKPKTTKDDVRYLVSFMKSLTDPCVKDRACMSKWIPEANSNDPDGLTLHAVDASSGKPL